MRPLLAVGLALTSTLALAACGGGGGGDGGTTSSRGRTLTEPATLPSAVRTATAPETTPTVPPTATATTAAKPKPKPRTTTSPESNPGGAGDEAGIRVPATFVLSGGRLVPPSVGVPAFLRIAFSIRNRDPKRAQVVFRGHAISVPRRSTVTILVPGLKKGSYPVTVNGRRRASVVSGVQAGP